jgi:chorismate lyase/3-hydroxybenzoate synthase
MYSAMPSGGALPEDALAAIVFGDTPGPSDPRSVRIGLPTAGERKLVETWRGSGPVRIGEIGPIRFAEDGTHLAAFMEVEESRFGGLAKAAEAAYRALLDFHSASCFRHIWRIWNIVSDINEGPGDDERYKLFCLGRARAFAATPEGWTGIGYPAATAVGCLGGTRTIQICWFAGTAPGLTIENPRQTSAYRYPRQYGPAAPTFSRALLAPNSHLFISGTASIVGHSSVHLGDIDGQLAETQRNLAALVDRAAKYNFSPAASPLVKVYLRPGLAAAPIEQALLRQFGADAQVMTLSAEICRSELLLEIEAIL